MERFKMIASGYIFLIRDGNILLSRRFQTGYQDGKYSLPAGHMEEHEPISVGTAREIFEEIGLRVEPSALKLAHVMHRRDKDERMDFFFTIDSWTGTPKNMEPEKCDDLSWFPLDKLPENTIPYIAAAIQNFQAGKIFSEFGWGE